MQKFTTRIVKSADWGKHSVLNAAIAFLKGTNATARKLRTTTVEGWQGYSLILEDGIECVIQSTTEQKDLDIAKFGYFDNRVDFTPDLFGAATRQLASIYGESNSLIYNNESELYLTMEVTTGSGEILYFSFGAVREKLGRKPMSTIPAANTMFNGRHYGMRIVSHRGLGAAFNRSIDELKYTNHSKLVIDIMETVRVHTSEMTGEQLARLADIQGHDYNKFLKGNGAFKDFIAVCAALRLDPCHLFSVAFDYCVNHQIKANVDGVGK